MREKTLKAYMRASARDDKRRRRYMAKVNQFIATLKAERRMPLFEAALIFDVEPNSAKYKHIRPLQGVYPIKYDATHVWWDEPVPEAATEPAVGVPA